MVSAFDTAGAPTASRTGTATGITAVRSGKHLGPSGLGLAIVSTTASRSRHPVGS